ncbi:eukaryotic translation initiation factor mextil isoform X3 [Lycorma delicatula]|uniref:eukaryotic translation initiation factor mextil isoform X3 n=1 Tax=Lycorma delicatula TaxID=130591 RepID=UPI003F510437
MASGVIRFVSTRNVKKLERPRPLKTTPSETHNKYSSGQLDNLMCLVENVSQHIINTTYDDTLRRNILTLSDNLKVFGCQLEPVYKDQLDRAFVSFRNGTRDENLDYKSRLTLLELIELRAKEWQKCDDMDDYYSRLTAPLDAFNSNSTEAALPSPTLGPGEVLKKSGKYSKPTKIPGKNYCKDEVVIRNSDSGKVMGIKGRRVHMIEELSETIISFQRVNPGAKERLVQITGPSEDKIIHARQLMEDTIRRNASPVREMCERERMGGSSSSLNSSASDESNRLPFSGWRGTRTLLHSLSTPDASIGEYKYSVTVGNDTIKITGTNHDLVRTAKLVLDEHFAPEPYQNFRSDCYTHFEEDVLMNSPSHTSLGKRLGSLDLGNGGPSNSSVDIDYAYGISRQPMFTSSRPVLSRSGSVHSQDLKDNSLKSKRTEYSIEFLMKCLESPFCKLAPPNWDRISKEFPAIVKQECSSIDPEVFLKKRNEVKERTTVISSNSSPDPE